MITLDCSETGQIKLKGHVCADNVMPLVKQGRDYIQKCPTQCIEIHLSELSQSDSSALALLMAWLRCAKNYKKQLRYVNIPSFLQHVISMYGIDDMFSN